MFPPKKRVAPLESLTPKLIKRVQFWCFDAISALWSRCFKSASIQIEVFLEKLQPFYTFWCELNSEMIWKMTWYSYVTVKICIFRSLKDMATSKDQTKHLRNWPNSTRCCQDSASFGSCIAYHYMHQLGIHLMRKYTSVYLSRSLQKCSGSNLVSTNTLNQA